MGEKFWIQDFETFIDRLRVHFVSEQGQVKSIIVIQYEAYIDGRWRPIIRFDEAQGSFIETLCHPLRHNKKQLTRQMIKVLP
jgi:hypothetical protein